MNRACNSSVIVFGLLLATLPVFSQSAFVNLDFESAHLTPIPSGQRGGHVPFDTALPGWAGYWGEMPATYARQNNNTLGTASIDILGPVAWNYNDFGPSSIEGRYAVMLQPGGAVTNAAIPVSTSIAQFGLVPTNALSLRFKGYIYGLGGNASVSLGGQDLALIPLASGANYTLYGADVSSYAGQVSELKFTAHLSPNLSAGALTLDSIVFSPDPVPEPSVAALVALCGVLFVFFKYRRSLWS